MNRLPPPAALPVTVAQDPAGSGLNGLNEDEVRGTATEISGPGDAYTLDDATAYTDGREDAIRDDMATGDTNTLNQANEYTDIALQQLIGFDASELEGRVTAPEDPSDDTAPPPPPQDPTHDPLHPLRAAMPHPPIHPPRTPRQPHPPPPTPDPP